MRFYITLDEEVAVHSHRRSSKIPHQYLIHTPNWARSRVISHVQICVHWVEKKNTRIFQFGQSFRCVIQVVSPEESHFWVFLGTLHNLLYQVMDSKSVKRYLIFFYDCAWPLSKTKGFHPRFINCAIINLFSKILQISSFLFDQESYTQSSIYREPFLM